MASIRKRTWKSKDGTPQTAWITDYFDQNGKRHIKTFATQRAARDWSTTVLHEVQQGTHTAASASITVGDLGKLWLEHCEAEGLERSTVRQRRQHLDLHITPFLGRAKLSDLTMPRIYKFDGELRKGGRSSAMRTKVITNVKVMLTFAQSQGLVAQNVARGVRIKNEERHTAAGPLREGVDFPSKAELKALMDKATGRWRPLLVTAIFTGMRASELRGLRWIDVDLEAGMIHVRQRADSWCNIGPCKSKAGLRDIPLTPMVVNALRQWQPDCPTRDGKLEFVFPNGAGNVEKLQNIWTRFWIPIQVDCDLSVDTGRIDEQGKPVMEHRYGFHMLRHAAASLFM